VRESWTTAPPPVGAVGAKKLPILLSQNMCFSCHKATLHISYRVIKSLCAPDDYSTKKIAITETKYLYLKKQKINQKLYQMYL
jgi:hypothetical protein